MLIHITVEPTFPETSIPDAATLADHLLLVQLHRKFGLSRYHRFLRHRGHAPSVILPLTPFLLSFQLSSAIRLTFPVASRDALLPISLMELVSSGEGVPHARAVSESLYTDSLEAILEELDEQGRQLETTHTARPSEVKQYLARCVDSMKSELDGHLEIGSLTKYVGDDAKALLSTLGAEVLPALAVYTAKPPKAGSSKAYRRKCRAVACGNHIHVTSEEDSYSAGAQAESVRLGLAMASQESWAAYVTDISQAFLRAPLPNLERLILLRPPSHFIQAGISQASEVWQAHRAVYGLREAPKWWAEILRGSSWTVNDETMRLEQLEGSVWLKG